MEPFLKLRQGATTKHYKDPFKDPHLDLVKVCNQVSNLKQELYYDKDDKATLMNHVTAANINNVLDKDWYKYWGFDVKNPFNKYGVLPSQLIAKARRKTNSAPLFTCNEHTTSTATVISTKDDFAASLSVKETNAMVNRTSTVVVSRVRDKSRDRDSIHNVSTTRKRYKEVAQGIDLYKSASTVTDTSCDVNTSITDLDDTESLKTSSDTVKSGRDSLDCFSSVALLQRLYSCTKNPYFAAREHSELSYFQPHDPPDIGEDFVARAILAGGESRLCVDLFYDLESIATRPYKLGQKTALKSMRPKYPRLAASPVSPPIRFALALTEEDKLVFRASTESARAAMRKAGMVSSYLHKPYDINDDFMLTDAEDYAILTTKFGRVVYSPKLADNKYMYRFVILTKEAQEAVESLAKRYKHKHSSSTSSSSSSAATMTTTGTTTTSLAVAGKQQVLGKRLLSEYEIIRELGIQMSPGWQHFMYFKNQQRELVLRKPL